MNICKEVITPEMRKTIKNDVLPEAMRFTESVFPYLSEWDVDKLDRIVIEDSVQADEMQALFSIEYDPELYSCIVKGCFYALSADIESSLFPLDAIKKVVKVCNEDMLCAMRKALSESRYQEYEISYSETDEYDDELVKRIKWTAKTSFSLEGDLYTDFMYAYNKTLCVIALMYKVYETYAVNEGLSDFYMELMGVSSDDRKVFDAELTAPVYTRGKLMTEYDSHLVDGFGSLRRIYQSVEVDITSTTLTVEMVKAEKPSVFITSEIILEEDDGNLDPDDFEYNQSFYLGKACGNSRSVFHGEDVVARFYYVAPEIYVLEPLTIYFENDSTNYLIITRDTDGTIHFFTDAKDEIALLEKNEENYHASIEYGVKELAPFIVAAEKLIFEPGQKQVCNKPSEEDKSFRRMKGRINKAKVKMSAWFKAEDYKDIIHDPAANLFLYLKRENPCEESLKGNTVTYDEVFFVQDTKDRSFGIDYGKDTDRYDAYDRKYKQLRLSDL